MVGSGPRPVKAGENAPGENMNALACKILSAAAMAPWAAVTTPAAARGPDGGPLYTETHLDQWIAEPWNAASALLFLAIAAFWIVRLRGRYRRHAFLTACLPILVVGGVGGTVYHAFRAHRIWLLLDWVPIVVLGLAVSVYLWSRLLRRWWPGLLIVPAVFVFQRLNFALLPIGVAINLSYSILAAIVAVPTVLVLRRNRFRHAVFPLAGAACFVAAILARAADARYPGLLPMGTHFLWHVFGAGAGQMMAEFLYRLGEAGEGPRPPARGRAGA